MKNVSHKTKWNAGVVLVHVDSPPIPMIKSKHDDKLDKDFVKLELRRDPTSENLDLYEFKMTLFNNGEPEEILLFVRNWNMTFAALGVLEISEKVQ